MALLASVDFKIKLVKCLEVLLKNAHYLKEVKFYSAEPSRITLLDVLNFIDDVRAALTLAGGD